MATRYPEVYGQTKISIPVDVSVKYNGSMRYETKRGRKYEFLYSLRVGGVSIFVDAEKHGEALKEFLWKLTVQCLFKQLKVSKNSKRWKKIRNRGKFYAYGVRKTYIEVV